MAVATLVAPPLTSKSTVPDLSPLPVTIAIPDTDPVSLTVTFLSGVCATVDSAPVPEISNSTVLDGVEGTNFSSADPLISALPSSPKKVLCGA